MKITIENTSKVISFNGIPARVWEGVTEKGVPVHCFITRVAVATNQDCSEFDRDLTETRAPSPEVEAYPARLLL